MMSLRKLLTRVPAVYAELGHAMLPGRSGGEGPSTSPDPRHRPAPGNLEVIDHRHLLVTGLRWWLVDRAPTSVTESVARMCAWIASHPDAFTAAEAETLQANLWDWCGKAIPLVGDVPAPSAPMLPREALDRHVPVHVAAHALGVSVSTVKRRTVGNRQDGTVLLRDAAGELCVHADLPPAWCADCRKAADRVRTVTAGFA